MPLRHSVDDLQQMAEVHVTYELTMLGWTATLGVEEGNLLAGYAVLEAYLLHVRNLDEFLRKPQSATRASDVVAADFFDDQPPNLYLAFDEKARSDLHRRLAHITTDRLTTNRPGRIGYSWKRGISRAGWARDVLREFGRFVGDLRVAHPDRAAWFAPALTDAKRGLRRG